MLWAENLLLLMTDHRTGRLVVSWSRVDLMLAASVLEEMCQAGVLAVEHPERPKRPGRIHVLDPQPTGDPIIDEAIAAFGGSPRRPAVAMHRVKHQLRHRLYQGLQERGIVRHEKRSFLGLLQFHDWPVIDAHREDELAPRITAWWDAAARQQTSAAVFPRTPSASPAQQRALADLEAGHAVALIEAVNAVRPVVKRLDLAHDPKVLRKAAAEVRKQSWTATVAHNILTSQQAAAAS